MDIEISRAWYLSRASALVGFFLLYISIFLGLSIRTPFLNQMIKPVYSYRAHCWISLQALFFVAVHGISLLFDNYLNFNWGNIFIPFYPQEEILADPVFLALGVVAFYIMLILIVSSYLKKYIGQAFWRAIHFLNIGLYAISLVHALSLGTDMKNETVRNVFISANVFLGLLMIFNLTWRIFSFIKNKKISQYEDIRDSQSEIIEK